MVKLALPAALTERLAAVTSVGVITGAGVSAESGIPTYRGAGGLYDDPERGAETVEALTGSTLRHDPDRTWRAIATLARLAAGARPNAGHLALADLESRMPRFALLTQNVDGLHQLAGSRNVIDIHGNVFQTLCLGCERRDALPREVLPALTAAPRCGACGAVLRPHVVLFEELLPQDKLLLLHLEFYQRPPDLVVAAGTTALFPYIAEPVLAAARAGRLTIEVNPEETDLSPFVDFRLRGPAGAWLPLLARALGASPA